MKKIGLLLATVSLGVMVVCGFAVKKDAIVVDAADEESTSQTIGEEPVKEEPTVAQWISDKIVPLVGGFSVANIIGIAISIITTVMKTRGDRKTSVLINGQDETICVLKDQVRTLMLENKKYASFAEEMLKNYEEVLTKSKATMDEVSNVVMEVSKNLSAQNEHIENVERMKNSIDVSCNLAAKMLALSDVAVKSGIAEDAKRLVDSLNSEGGNSDGQEG